MIRKRKKLIAIIISVVLIFGLFPMINTSGDFSIVNEATAATEVLTLDQLRAKFPNGKYWNHAGNPGSSNSVNNQDGWTSTPCSVHGVVGTSKQTCNGFSPSGTQLSWQCMGYAEKLGYDSTGYNPRANANGWTTSYSTSALDNLKAGDIVRYKNDVHSIFVTGVNGDIVTYTDCNSDGHCIIRWDATISKSTLRSTFTYVRVSPRDLSEGSSSIVNNPIGMLDSATGGVSCVTVRGWTLDYDSLNTQLDVHVYIGGPAGSGAPCYVIKADKLRSDVEDVYGSVGQYHGFEEIINTTLTGSQPVYVYAINVGNGSDNTLLGSETVNITSDTESPVFKSVSVVEKTSNGYTVRCEVADENGIEKVLFPTWTEYNGQDDLYQNWMNDNTCAGTKDGDTYTFEVFVKDHNDETGSYNTHIYAYDKYGNVSKYELEEVIVPEKGVSVESVEITDITATGYTVKCKVADGTVIDRALFPTWTAYNGQDDLYSKWQYDNTCAGTIDGNTISFRVDVKDHNSETGIYKTHIYVYDKDGNFTKVEINRINISSEIQMVKAVEITDITPAGYTVKCEVSDVSKVEKALFPTWTDWKGQDDLDGNWTSNSTYAGTKDGGSYIFRVNSNDHNNETGIYETHIYVYGKDGDSEKVEIENIYVPDAYSQYSVSYNANGGTGTPSSQSKTYGVSLTLSSTIPTRNGYNFLGWNTKADGSGTSYAKGAVYTENASVCLYAQWSRQTYTVSYNANGGTGAPKSQIKIYGEDLTLTSAEPSRNGYTFAGWNTKTDGSGTNYLAGSVYAIDESLTLYAVWKEEIAGGAQFVIDSTIASVGDTFTVQIATLNNPGIISLLLQINYDSKILELQNATSGDLSAVSFGPITNTPFTISWSDAISGNMDKDVVIAELTFKVIDTTEAGYTMITVSFEADNIFDEDWNNIDFQIDNGTITIVDYCPGDVNGDGKVNMKDYALFQQYLNGWDVEIIMSAADVNADGKQNMKDLALLQQYLNGWDVILK